MLYDSIRPVRWRDDALELLDQRLLPGAEQYLRLEDAGAVVTAIRDMVVRGAPAIGIAAAYGVAMAARDAWRRSSPQWRALVEDDLAALLAARPTAVNLAWAVARMRRRIAEMDGAPFDGLLAEAHAMFAEDLAANYRMGELGAALIDTRCSILTHCNAGALATAGYGTALGVVRAAQAGGRLESVYADETRPWLQGARLTAWELVREGIPVQLLADSAAGFAMRQGLVHWVIVGADRVAANGDVANKIGTLALAANARYHGVRFMVVAPTSTIDADCPDGAHIPIEQRAGDELLALAGTRIAAAGVAAWNPVFDVTPAELVDVLVTERGVIERPDRESIGRLMRDA